MDTICLNATEIEKAAELIQAGKLVAFPTETVYGLGADATQVEAVKKVYQAKGRPSDNPLIVHVASQKELVSFVGELSAESEKLITTFWPGPLTLIFPVDKDVLPAVLNKELQTIAFRMPQNKSALALIKAAGVPLVGPSANTSGRPSPTTAAHVFHDLQGKISAIVNDGPTKVGVESTVLDLSVTPPVILRPGNITQSEIESVIGPLASFESDESLKRKAPRAPGMKYRHYAPEKPVWIVTDWQRAFALERFKGKKIGMLASRSLLEKYREQVTLTYELTKNNLVEEAMQHLFAGLRALDEAIPEIDVIFVQDFPSEGKGLSYMNRLEKAANGQKIE